MERLWPRGVSKERLAVGQWQKDIAPSPELRKWYGHDPDKWEAFRERYEAELRANPAAVDELRSLLKEKGTLTLVYAARDEGRSSALVLKEFLERKG